MWSASYCLTGTFVRQRFHVFQNLFQKDAQNALLQPSPPLPNRLPCLPYPSARIDSHYQSSSGNRGSYRKMQKRGMWNPNEPLHIRDKGLSVNAIAWNLCFFCRHLAPCIEKPHMNITTTAITAMKMTDGIVIAGLFS